MCACAVAAAASLLERSEDITAAPRLAGSPDDNAHLLTD